MTQPSGTDNNTLVGEVIATKPNTAEKVTKNINIPDLTTVFNDIFIVFSDVISNVTAESFLDTICVVENNREVSGFITFSYGEETEGIEKGTPFYTFFYTPTYTGRLETIGSFKIYKDNTTMISICNKCACSRDVVWFILKQGIPLLLDYMQKNIFKE